MPKCVARRRAISLSILVTLLAAAPSPAAAPSTDQAGRLELPTYGIALNLSDQWLRRHEMGVTKIGRWNLVKEKVVLSALDVEIVAPEGRSAEKFVQEISRSKHGAVAPSPVAIGGSPTFVVTFNSPGGEVRPRRIYVVENESWIYQFTHFAMDETAGQADVEAVMRQVEWMPIDKPPGPISFRGDPVGLLDSGFKVDLPDPVRLEQSKRENEALAGLIDLNNPKGGMTIIVGIKPIDEQLSLEATLTLSAQQLRRSFKLEDFPRFTELRPRSRIYTTDTLFDGNKNEWRVHLIQVLAIINPKKALSVAFMITENDDAQVEAYAEVAKKIIATMR